MGSISAILSPTQRAEKPKLLDQVRDVIRRKHFSIRTEQAWKIRDYARAGTLAVRSSLPQLTQAPLMARRIAFHTQ